MSRENSDSEALAAEDRALFAGNEEDEATTEDREAIPQVLKQLTETLTHMSTSMINMEQSFKRMNSAESTASHETAAKRKRTVEQADQVDSEDSDGEALLRKTTPKTKPPAYSATEGDTDVSSARLEQDALLREIS
jgi:hypothetical protein